jgi:hypothetical protein
MLIQVMTKARVFKGTAYPAKETEFSLLYNEDGSLTVFRNRQQGATFKVGDKASYDSYNLVYVGEITKITNKAISIIAYKGNIGMEKLHRLSLYEFSWRNHNFNMTRVAAANAEEMMYI